MYTSGNARGRNHTCTSTEYKIDGETNILEPIGMLGRRLETICI